jgi:hypothetical protein
VKDVDQYNYQPLPSPQSCSSLVSSSLLPTVCSPDSAAPAGGAAVLLLDVSIGFPLLQHCHQEPVDPRPGCVLHGFGSRSHLGTRWPAQE